MNCQSLKSSSKQQKPLSLIVAHDIQLLFLCETCLHNDIKTSEVKQGSCFKEIDRTDRNKGEHSGLLIVANTYYPAYFTDFSILKFSKFSIGCLVTCRSSCFMYVLFYNSPSSSPYREPYSLIVECLQAYIIDFLTHCSMNGIQYFSDNVHFVGDFNFPGINC